MGERDEFDGQHGAPVPPHERNWLHPAEVSDARRQDHALHSTPPPIGRRAAALVSFVSIVASAVVMLVTVQKGVSDPTVEPAETTTSSVTGKGVQATGAVIGVRAFGEFFVVPSKEVPRGNLRITADGSKPFAVDVVARITSKGVTVVKRRPGGSGGDETDDSLPMPAGPVPLTAVDRTGQRMAVTTGIDARDVTAMSEDDKKWFPLNVDGVINGVAALFEGDHFYAIAVRHQHVHYGITLDDLASLVSGVTAAGTG